MTNQQAFVRFASDLRARLAGEKPSTLETLLAERVVLSWAFLNWADAVYISSCDTLSLKQSEFQVKRIELANWNLMAAVKTLAKVQRRNVPDVLALVNVAAPNPALVVPSGTAWAAWVRATAREDIVRNGRTKYKDAVLRIERARFGGMLEADDFARRKGSRWEAASPTLHPATTLYAVPTSRFRKRTPSMPWRSGRPSPKTVTINVTNFVTRRGNRWQFLARWAI